MSSSDYQFETRWRGNGTLDEVCAILSDAKSLSDWWPDVYLSVRETEPGVYTLLTRGWLPYTLRWSFTVTDSQIPHTFSIRAWGDLEGTGTWTLEADGEWTSVRYLWTVRANKPILRYLSFLMKPVFAANHRWAMARGEESLTRELARRRTISF